VTFGFIPRPPAGFIELKKIPSSRYRRKFRLCRPCRLPSGLSKMWIVTSRHRVRHTGDTQRLPCRWRKRFFQTRNHIGNIEIHIPALSFPPMMLHCSYDNHFVLDCKTFSDPRPLHSLVSLFRMRFLTHVRLAR